MEDLLRRLLTNLPTECPKEPEIQARAVLRLVLTEQPVPASVAAPVAPQCPNCAAPTTSTRSPYCGEHCREVAGFVRQFRAGVALGWIIDPEKQVALGQVLWHVLGGGRPLRQALIAERSRRQAMERSEGKCASCGAPATTFDHLGSGCNRSINLRPVCDGCAVTRPFGDSSILARPEVQALLGNLAYRLQSPSPALPCDDPDSWDWRAYLAAARPTQP